MKKVKIPINPTPKDSGCQQFGPSAFNFFYICAIVTIIVRV